MASEKKIKIKFNSEDDKVKGLGLMYTSKLGFSGVGGDIFWVPKDIIDILYLNEVEFTVLNEE